MALTAGASRDALEELPPGGDAVDAFLEVAELSLRLGVSCALEYVFRLNRPGDLERMLAAGDAVVIVTRCSDPEPRLIERNRNDRLVADAVVLRAAGVPSVAEHTAAMVERMRLVQLEMMITFPVSTLRVDTTDGYDPDFEVILDFAVG